MEQEVLTQEGDLYETVSSLDQLHTAWKQVKANRGAPGVDGVSTHDFDANLIQELKKLSAELRDWTYQPQPVRRVEIPKPGSAGKRKLGIPCVRDRVVQQSLRISLEPIFDPEFSESSFGFRPGRGQQDAIRHAERLVKDGKDFVVDIDLEKFFDRINHDRLIYLVGKKVHDKRILRLLGITLRSGVLEEEAHSATPEGSPQGSPVSPLLSNIVLDELDKELEKRGLSFSRYADDAKIYVGSRKAGDRVMRSIGTFIENRLKLRVNREKSKVVESKDSVFLGFVITKEAVMVSLKSLQRAMAKTKALIPRRTHIPLEYQIRSVNRWYRGWATYYSLGNYPSHLAAIEAHIRRRFRAQFVRNQKRRRHLVKTLLRRGATSHGAYAAAYSSKRWWALSHTRTIERAWDNAWFRRQGLLTYSKRKLSHWHPLGAWVAPL